MGTGKKSEGGWVATLNRRVINLLTAGGRVWLSFRQWYQILQPARACLLASLLVPLLFALVDQGRDTLRLVASKDQLGHELWMLLGMFVAGLASWSWARFLLHCKFPGSPEIQSVSADEVEKARRILRRTCGLLPPLGMALGFLFAAHSSGNTKGCLIWAGLSAVMAALLWLLFECWRNHQEKQRGKSHGKNDAQGYHFEGIEEIWGDTFAKWAIVVAWAVSALIFLGMTWWPVSFGEQLGSPAVILFAIASWISIGSVFIYAANRYRIPLLTMLFLWAVFCSLFNDNHDVRTLPNSSAGTPPQFYTALDQWHDNVTTNFPQLAPGKKRPIYLVAAAGGGIRAAYWTAIVLGQLEDCARSNGTSFAANTFILSGVSGGSLGEVTFTSLMVHHPADKTNFTANAQKLLNEDFLAADLAKMAYADLLQRFLPFPVTGFDRARSLEDAWATAWKDEFHADVLNKSVDQLYMDAADAGVILPHLLLNGTCVETGQRIITSDLTIMPRVESQGRPVMNGIFLDTVAAGSKLFNAPIRLSTAAHQSARFTYFSPAGRFPDGTHVVDGGYFENSGASTLIDALKSIQWQIGTRGWTDIEPRIILINNDPIVLPSKQTNGINRLPGIFFSRLMRETLSPVRALLNTRTARGNYAVEEALEYGSSHGLKVYEFNLFQRQDDERLGECPEPAELPLGWTLSSCAMNEMNAQLTLPFSRATNSVTISEIVASLPQPPQPAAKR